MVGYFCRLVAASLLLCLVACLPPGSLRCHLAIKVTSAPCQNHVSNVTFALSGTQHVLPARQTGPGMYVVSSPCSFLLTLRLTSPGFDPLSFYFFKGHLNQVELHCQGGDCFPYETTLTVVSGCERPFDGLTVDLPRPGRLIERESPNTFVLGHCMMPLPVTVRDSNHGRRVAAVNSSPETLTMDCDKPGPLNGLWGAWTMYSFCSVTCGFGVRTRQRDCDSPAPEPAGRDCIGPDSETEECFQRSCPVDGGWTLWQFWSECPACSFTAGVSVSRTRSRMCTNPIPSSGGAMCTGQWTEIEPCPNIPVCPVPVDGGWSPWALPYGCPNTRTCTNPAPAFGGLDCVGPSFVYDGKC